jgi:iron complex outermembrane recepter protein
VSLTAVDGFPGARARRAPAVLAITLVLASAAEARADEHEACVRRARSPEEIDACPPPDEPLEVRVQAKPPPRSASDWVVDEKTVRNAPSTSSADALQLLPGVFVSDKGLPGRAPSVSLRGFDGTSGQDVELYMGNIPMNQISHIRAPGYADMRLLMPEVIQSLRISNGPFDPRQGDFAVAGSVHMDLGLEHPGFWAKGGLGSFGGRRLFLGFAPASSDLTDTFAAFVTDSTNGPGGTRGGERTSFVAQLGTSKRDVQFHVTVALGSARFDFPGFLEQSFVERGGDPYAATGPLGRDRTSQALIGSEVVWTVGEGTLGIGAFAGKTKTSFHQNLTGYVLDELAGLPPKNSDDSEQVNDAGTIGLTTQYRHAVDLVSKHDAFELGLSSRLDGIDQSDTRLFPDGTINQALVDANITATSLGAYADAAIHPMNGLVLRGGPRLDSLSFSVNDKTGNAGLERTSQGFHVGGKGTVDLTAGKGVHLVASYGDGFRSPEAKDLREGERVVFSSVHSAETGLRWRLGGRFQASAVAFGSWLDHDRIFDAVTREYLEAPSSMRIGGATALSARSGPFGANVAATYTRATFTGSDDTFHKGELVPYAPEFVLRDDVFLKHRLGTVAGERVHGRVGVGVEGAAGRPLPPHGEGGDVVDLSAVAALGWRWVEVAVNGTNLLNLRYDDSEYVYVSNFARKPVLPAPTTHVLVAAPLAVFVTLEIHVRGKKSESDQHRERLCLKEAVTDDEEERCKD